MTQARIPTRRTRTATNQESAWCEFDEELAPGGSLAVTGSGISTKPDARAENISSIIYRWVSKKYVDERGGLQVVADEWTGQGTKAVRSTGDALTLTTPAGPLGGLGGPIGFAGVKLVTPSTSEPTATPTPTVTPSATTTVAPTPASSASPGAPGGDGGDGGEGGGLRRHVAQVDRTADQHCGTESHGQVGPSSSSVGL